MIIFFWVKNTFFGFSLRVNDAKDSLSYVAYIDLYEI